MVTGHTTVVAVMEVALDSASPKRHLGSGEGGGRSGKFDPVIVVDVEDPEGPALGERLAKVGG